MNIAKNSAGPASSTFTLQNPESSSIMEGRKASRAPSVSSVSSSRRRTRTAKACDRCRFKKSKCDGHQPCRRCSKDDSPCLYSSRVNAGRKASMFETLSLMSEGLQMMYQAFQQGEPFPSRNVNTPLKSNNPSAHEILEYLGLIKAQNEDHSSSSSSSPSPGHDSIPDFNDQVNISGEEAPSLDSSPPSHSQESEWSLGGQVGHSASGPSEFTAGPFTSSMEWATDKELLLDPLDNPYMFPPIPGYLDVRQQSPLDISNDYLLQAVR